LLTGYGKLLLAEFKYGLEPKETFGSFTDQGKSRLPFYWLKKNLFPYAYWKYMVSVFELNHGDAQSIPG
jgi:sulfide:quinone oxidoreductase